MLSEKVKKEIGFILLLKAILLLKKVRMKSYHISKETILAKLLSLGILKDKPA